MEEGRGLMADSDVTNKNPQTSWPAGFLIQMIRGHLLLLTCGDILNLVDNLLILTLGLEMDAESDDGSNDAAVVMGTGCHREAPAIHNMPQVPVPMTTVKMTKASRKARFFLCQLMTNPITDPCRYLSAGRGTRRTQGSCRCRNPCRIHLRTFQQSPC